MTTTQTPTVRASTGQPALRRVEDWWLRAWLTTHRWVWVPIAIYLVARAAAYLLVDAAQMHQMPMSTSNVNVRIFYERPPHPGYQATMTNWDAQWYEKIAREGYPRVLPTDARGEVMMNPWAFFPVYPTIVGVLMQVTGLSFVAVAPTLSLVLGAAAMVVLYRLVHEVLGDWYAFVAVTLTSFHMAAPVLGAAYTESLALLLVVSLLWLLRHQVYWAVALLLPVLALTRNVVAAMVPVILAHAVVQWRNHQEGVHPWLHRALLVCLAIMSGLLTWLWPAVIEHVTGTPDAYAKTLKPWGFEATSIKSDIWYQVGVHYLTRPGVALVIASLGVYAMVMVSPVVRRWGPELWAWGCAYPAYMLLVVAPTSSVVRYSLLAFPVALLVAWVLDARELHEVRWPALGVLVALGVYLQWLWVSDFLVITTPSLEMLYP